MKQKRLKTFYVSTNKICCYENNPRDNDKAAEALVPIIRHYGFRMPLLLTNPEELVVVCGETRLKAAKLIGLTELPVYYAEDMSPEDIKGFRIAENKTHEYACWDTEKLQMEMELLTKEYQVDPAILGFSAEEVDEILGNMGDEIADAEREASFHYREQYGVIIICRSEAEQQRVYEQLVEQGYSCKVVAT